MEVITTLRRKPTGERCFGSNILSSVCVQGLRELENEALAERLSLVGKVTLQLFIEATPLGGLHFYGIITKTKIPVVIGRITDWKVWKFGAIVRKAQASFVEADPSAALVTSTDSYGNSDPWHYDTAGYLDLGEQFAKALISVEKGHSK